MASNGDFKVFRSSAGLGLKALAEFRRGDQIIEYTGPRITSEQADAKPNRYLFEIDDDWTIDGSVRSNLARYINHSCRPNARAVHHEDEDRIFIEALRRIRTGDEITYNYGKRYFEDYIEPAGCMCTKCQETRQE